VRLRHRQVDADGRAARDSHERLVDALPSSPRVDPLGLSTVLLLGFALGRRTVVAGVEASVATWDGREDPGRAASADDAYGLVPRADRPSDGELLELVVEAARRETGDEPPIALLSGGRDSRLVLLALRAAGIRTRGALTTGSAPDRVVARALSSAVGVPLREVEPLAFSRRRFLDRHDEQSYASLEHEWMEGAAAAARATGAPITDGIGAGVLPTGGLLKPEPVGLWRARRLDELAEWTLGHANGAGVGFHERLRARGVPLAHPDDVRGELVRVFRALEALPNPLGAFSLVHWTGRGIAASAFGLVGRGRRVVAPLFDRGVCEALLAFDLDDCLAGDWRERLLARLDDTGVAHSVDDGSGRLGGWRRAMGALRWKLAGRSLPPPLAEALDASSDASGAERRFRRPALGLLLALDRSVGGVVPR
jgi:hypothetical protein